MCRDVNLILVVIANWAQNIYLNINSDFASRGSLRRVVCRFIAIIKCRKVGSRPFASALQRLHYLNLTKSWRKPSVFEKR